MSSGERVRIALVGCGNIARAHWRGIHYHAPLIEVTAVVDADPARAAAMAERTGGRAFTSLSAALAEGDFDAVDLMLPHDLHEPAAIESFAAGKHVVLEKPMAPTLDACARIMAAAEASGRVFMIAEQSQFWPDVIRIRELLAAGAIGEVIWARAFFFDPLVRNPADPVPWRFRLARSGGGICIDGGAHWIRPAADLVRRRGGGPGVDAPPHRGDGGGVARRTRSSASRAASRPPSTPCSARAPARPRRTSGSRAPPARSWRSAAARVGCRSTTPRTPTATCCSTRSTAAAMRSASSWTSSVARCCTAPR